MTTHINTRSLNIFVALRARLKGKKKNPDWARIQEPDTFIPPVVLLVYAMVITVTAGMINYTFATPGTLEKIIADYLAPFVASGQSFDQVYAVFTFALLAIIEALAYTFIAILHVPDNDDIAEMIRDLDDNTQERIVELEHTINERLHKIENETLPFPYDMNEVDKRLRADGQSE